MAIVVPRVGEAIAGADAYDLERLRGYVRDRLARRTIEVPEMVLAEVPVTSGGEPVGAVLLLDSGGAEAPDGAHDVLNVVAIAVLTELAVADVREETEQAMRSSLIDLIRGNPELSDEDLLRRAYRVGQRPEPWRRGAVRGDHERSHVTT